MTIAPEVKRLLEVYRNYRESDQLNAKWSLTNPGNRAIVEERTRLMTRLLQVHGFFPLAQRQILDIGCGGGSILASFEKLGAASKNLYGVDLIPERICQAKESFPEIHFQVGNAENLHFQSASFDLVLLFTVFTSILDVRMASHISEEISRVLKPGGAVVWYDFRYNNPSNSHVRGMSKEAIISLFPNFRVILQPLTLLPPLSRRLGRLTPILYSALAAIPFLRTHYLGVLLKAA
jgi:SAM-dependent methyltransferase